MDTILYLVLPCYNEQELLENTAQVTAKKFKMLEKAGRISTLSKIVFVNDGSYDETWTGICKLHRQNKGFVGVNLSKNSGHQNALLAGMLYAKNKADAIITMDADLQDDIDAIDDMLDKLSIMKVMILYMEFANVVIQIHFLREQVQNYFINL